MDEKLKEQVEAHVKMKDDALKVVRKQREKALVSRPNKGRPTNEETRTAVKEVLEKPYNHKKEALKLFDQVISAKADTVFKKLLQKATDDDDRDQMAALKLIADRLAPIAQFTEQGSGNGSGGKVVINIAGLSADHTVTAGRVIDAEDVDV